MILQNIQNSTDLGLLPTEFRKERQSGLAFRRESQGKIYAPMAARNALAMDSE